MTSIVIIATTDMLVLGYWRLTSHSGSALINVALSLQPVSRAWSGHTCFIFCPCLFISESPRGAVCMPSGTRYDYQGAELLSMGGCVNELMEICILGSVLQSISINFPNMFHVTLDATRAMLVNKGHKVCIVVIFVLLKAILKFHELI